jgi:hypothetical protein
VRRGTGGHGERAADRHGVAQTGEPFRGRDADPGVAVAAVELGALPGDVTQLHQHRPGGGEQPVLAAGGGQLADPGAEHEASLHVAGHQAVVLERHREPVGRRARDAGGGNQPGERHRPPFEGTE